MKSTKVTAQQANKNADAILRFWKKGRDSHKHLRQLQSNDPHALRIGNKSRTFQNEATRIGVNFDTASKMRRVAQEYTLRQIEEIRTLVVRHRSRFGPIHMLALIRIKDRAQRDKLMRQAIREAWSNRQLKRTIQAMRGGRRPYVGRKPGVPSDDKQRLLVLQVLAEKFCRFCVVARNDLPVELQPLVTKATASLQTIQKRVDHHLHNLLR